MKPVFAKPVRKIGPSYRSMTGTFPFRGKAVEFESMLENDYLTTLLFDADVVDVLSQPIRIDFRDGTGRKRHYTPDYLVRYRTPTRPAVLAEVKYRSDLRKDWDELKPRFKAAIDYAQANGLAFRIITESTIRGRADIEALTFLAPYLARTPVPGVETPLLDTLARLGEASVDDLLIAAFHAEDERLAAIGPLWRLVATGIVGLDLSLKLGMASRLHWRATR